MAVRSKSIEAVIRQRLSQVDASDPEQRTIIYEGHYNLLRSLTVSRTVGSLRVRNVELRQAMEAVERDFPGMATLPEGLWPSLESQDLIELGDLPDIGQQNTVALVFKEIGAKLDVDLAVGRDALATDRDARDLHSELLRIAGDLTTIKGSDGIGGNALGPVIGGGQLLLSALGRAPAEVSPGLLIPRGEALRQILTQQEGIGEDTLSDVAPLPDSALAQLRLTVRTYNSYVALDAELHRRDLAQLGPDLVGSLVPPAEGVELARAAAKAGLLTKEGLDAIELEASIAPSVPSMADRRSRRYSESVKNLGRALIKLAITSYKVLSTFPAKVSIAYGATHFILANEQVLRGMFSTSRVATAVLDWLIPVLQKLPVFVVS